MRLWIGCNWDGGDVPEPWKFRARRIPRAMKKFYPLAVGGPSLALSLALLFCSLPFLADERSSLVFCPPPMFPVGDNEIFPFERF